MAHIIKKGPIKVPTQPKDFDLQATGLVFKSYDNQIALEFNVMQQDGTPADLLGANLRLLMFIYDEVDGMITKEPIPFITKNLITESFLNGRVVYILPEAMKAYNGMVEAYVYIEYPDGSTSDNLGFTFRMKRSAIDGLAQDKADYFIADFQQLLDGVKQEATDAVNEALAKVEAVSKNVSSAQNDLTILEDRIDQANQQIGDLGKLKEIYSNSIDFGDYDYSGRANLFLNLDFSKLSKNSSAITEPPAYVKDGGSHFVLDFSDASANGVDRTVYIPAVGRLEKGATYIATVPMMISDDFDTKYGTTAIYPYCVSANNAVTRVTSLYPDDSCRGKWGFIKKAFTVPANVSDGEFTFFQVYSTKAQVGKISIGYDIKIEKVTSTSDTATPYQPNLLDAPYYLSKAALGKNIADSTKTFPIKTSSYNIYRGNNTEKYQLNQTYTLTMKATKPSTQDFGVCLLAGEMNIGNMSPVEGLTDVWRLTFKVSQTHIDSDVTDVLDIYQLPKTSVGACQIDWVKLEKGDTRTPNIEHHRYKGLALLGTTEPTKYEWDYTMAEVDDKVSKAPVEPTSAGENASESTLQTSQVAELLRQLTTVEILKLTPENTTFIAEGSITFKRIGNVISVYANVKIKNDIASGAAVHTLTQEWKTVVTHGLIDGKGTEDTVRQMYMTVDDGVTLKTGTPFKQDEWFIGTGDYITDYIKI